MAVQYNVQAGLYHFVKGAPEVILSKCNQYFSGDGEPLLSATLKQSEMGLQCKPFSSELKRSAMKYADEFARTGLRIIALSYGVDLGNLIFVGFLAMYDPPREGIAHSISRLHESGVRVVMITGDSEGTAISIANQVGIYGIESPTVPLLGRSDRAISSKVLSGADLDGLSERQLQDVVGNVAVYYRTTPKHKLMIVKALQQRGDIVAMTGDGVNDAPALKLADIGIASRCENTISYVMSIVGKTGTDVSKEAADMILVNDEFGTILSAIEEGKSIFYNIQNFLRFQLSTSVAALVLIGKKLDDVV